MVVAMRTLAMLLLTVLLHTTSAVSAQPLQERALPAKPARTQVTPYDDTRFVVVKFAEGTRVRATPAGMRGDVPFDAAALAQVLREHGVAAPALRRLFTRPERDLEVERDRAQRRSRRELADLNLYHRIAVPAGVDVASLCDALNRLPFVELAAPAPRLALPVDLSPPTPDFSFSQGYLAAPPNGVGLPGVAAAPGSDGTGTALVDVEFNWVLDHEDLELDDSALLDDETPFPDPDHGTAVLGIVGALHNGYGIDGIAPEATLFGAYASTVESGDKIAEAISLATQHLLPGDVILVEVALPCACGECGASGFPAGPAEAFPPTFDAISIATSLGISVVEPAGNGSVDLDQPGCNGRFDRNLRDSGAIFVGAGTQARERAVFSSYGSRVDVQGWGGAVATLGFGDAFNPTPDARQRYTRAFGGTSGASAIVAGVALAVQGNRKAQGQPPLDPAALRNRLVSTGSPQTVCTFPSQHVGPLPNLPAALGLPECSDHLDNDGDGRIDAGADAGCSGPADPDESDVTPAPPLSGGDILLIDAVGQFDRDATAAVYHVAPQTGLQTRVLSGRPLLDPASAALDVDGDLLVTDFTNGTLVKIDLETGRPRVLARCMHGPWGVTVGPDRAIYVAAAGQSAVLKVDRDTGEWSALTSGRHLSAPRGIAVYGPGALVVADSGSDALVYVNRVTGHQILLASGANLTNVRGVAVDATGSTLYAADTATHSIVRVSLPGGAKTIVSSGGHLVTPRNIILDGAGRILVAEADDTDGRGSVLRIDPNVPGGSQTVLASGGDFVDPTGIAVVPEPGGALLTQAGVALLVWLSRRRAH
jgi:sugar lactone lactonase YvrE